MQSMRRVKHHARMISIVSRLIDINMRWPTRDERKRYKIQGFISNYSRLPTGRHLEVTEKRERPDYIVRDIATRNHFGVELTSVYFSSNEINEMAV